MKEEENNYYNIKNFFSSLCSKLKVDTKNEDNTKNYLSIKYYNANFLLRLWIQQSYHAPKEIQYSSENYQSKPSLIDLHTLQNPRESS